MRIPIIRFAFIITISMGMSSLAQARTVNAGDIWGHAGIGYSGVTSDALESGNHSLALHTEVEFDLSRWGGLLGGVALDFSSSTQVDLKAGLRFRIPGLESAWAPHLDMSYLLGGYTNIDEDNLLAQGVGFALGTEFFVTRDLMAGISFEWTRKRVTALEEPIHALGFVFTVGRELRLY